MNDHLESEAESHQSEDQDLAAMIATLSAWCNVRNLQLCILFGSQVTGKAHSNSDVDLALWSGERPSTAVRLRWLRELETSLNRAVSLVFITPDLDPVLGFEIVRDGHLVYENQPGLWSRHRGQLWHAYADSLPFRRAQRKQLSQFAEEIRRGA